MSNLKKVKVPKVERTQEQLQNDYMHALAQIGERVYRRIKMNDEVTTLIKQVDSIQLEASVLQAKLAKSQPVEVPAESKEVQAAE